jgi:hypothetical protein
VCTAMTANTLHTDAIASNLLLTARTRSLLADPTADVKESTWNHASEQRGDAHTILLGATTTSLGP